VEPRVSVSQITTLRSEETLDRALRAFERCTTLTPEGVEETR
jgi:hypothetical protein